MGTTGPAGYSDEVVGRPQNLIDLVACSDARLALARRARYQATMQSYVKWAVGLALADEGGDDDTARAHLGRVDPLLRGRARRRLQLELEACLAEDPDAPMGRPMLEAVADRIGARPAGDASRAPLWWATAMVLVGLVCGGVLAAYKIVTAPPAFSPDDMDTVVESRDAYDRGGRPLSLGEAGEHLFGEKMASFVIALDRHARKRAPDSEAALAAAEKELLADTHKELVGAEVYKALVNLTEACRATLLDGESVMGDVDDLNAALIDAGLAYHIDDSTLDHSGGTTPLLYMHFVEHVRVFEIPGEDPERVLWLRRIDNINYQTNMVGSTHRGAVAAVIRRDLVDDEVHERLLPVLGGEANYELAPTPRNSQSTPIKAELETTSGAKIREDFAAAGVDPDKARKLASLLDKRDELFKVVQVRAKKDGLRVFVPSGYRFDMEPYRGLGEVIGKKVLRDLDGIDDELGSADMADVYRKVRSAYVSAVELHELQHRLDYRREQVVPSVLSPFVGEWKQGDKLSEYGRRLTTEYSAFLAEIAHSELPFVAMIGLSRFAFNPANARSTYADAAVAVILSLCDALAIEHGDFMHERGIDRDSLAAAFGLLLGRSRDEVRQAAHAAWKRSFGQELVRPVALETKQARDRGQGRD